MSLAELGLWRAKWRTSPWGDTRADLRQAVTSYGIHAAWIKKRGGGHWSISDFLPFMRKREEKPKTPLEFMTAILGSRLIKGKLK